jgi:two-component system, NarL family, nitrate/nitrite response regulator NarL
VAITTRPCGSVLVVDDDEEFRGLLAGLLEYSGYRTMQAASGEEALEAADDETPALAILDICLPGISGYQVCHELRLRFGAGLPILFVSAGRTDACDRAAALLVGGDDYLAKPIAPDEFLIRVSRMIQRSTPLNPVIGGRLTAREQEVLRLLTEGLAPREIALHLVITEKTVRTHVDHIFGKLGVHSRAQAVALAFRRDLLTTPAGAAGSSARALD